MLDELHMVVEYIEKYQPTREVMEIKNQKSNKIIKHKWSTKKEKCMCR